jgi:hypothetical protein
MAVGQEATLLNSSDTSLTSAQQAVRQVGAELPQCDRNCDTVREWVAKSVGPEKLQSCGLNPDLYISKAKPVNQSLAREGLAAVQSNRENISKNIPVDFRQKFGIEQNNQTATSAASVNPPTATAVTASVSPATATVFKDQLSNSYKCIAEECLASGNLEAFNRLAEITDRDLPPDQADAIRAMAPPQSIVV